MFNKTFCELPVRYYSYKDYNTAIESLISDTLKLTGSNEYKQSYSIKEENDEIIFDCLAPSTSKENLSLSIKDRQLCVKTLETDSEVPYFKPINIKINLNKDINHDQSYAKLENGVLKIVMPLQEDSKEKKILFK